MDRTDTASEEQLSARHREILGALVELHIAEGRPVGSKAVAERLRERWSSATIRADMAELSDLGYLSQPHTSAGRVPTSLAYREYVARLLRIRRVDGRQRSRLERLRQLSTAARGSLGREALLQLAGKALVECSPYAGLVIAPRAEAAVLSRLEFVPMGRRSFLAVLITREGRVHQRLVTVDFDVKPSDLEHFHNYLNTWACGLSLTQIRDRIERELERERAAADTMVRAALLAGQQALDPAFDDADVYIEGKARFLEMADFESLEKLRPVLLALERKEGWLRLLERSIGASRMLLDIGAESVARGLEECSVITARYGATEAGAGTLGIIGPIRMDYARTIPLVELTAATLSEILACHNA
jgi:heat-inducible transcriptional repressor